MDNKRNSKLSVSLDQVADFRGRQAAILAEIDSLTRATLSTMSPNRGAIASLKQEYNEIVEKRAELESDHLPDPLQVLPPELWPNVFGEVVHELLYPVDVLLELTLVSQTWLDALVSLAQLWTKIRLDHTEADYLAKALMGIHLSVQRDIELHIGHLRLDEWRTISPRITPHSRRIKCLSFVGGHLLPREELGILRDLSELPVLRNIVLRQRHKPELTVEDLREVEMEKMPSLERIEGLKLGKQYTPWNRFITSHGVASRTQVDIDSLALLPGLRTLTIGESVELHGGKNNHSSNSVPCLKSVEELFYNGDSLLRSMKWFGDSLTSLSFRHPQNTDPAVVLLALSRFHHLQFLTIIRDRDIGIWPTQDTRNEAKFDLSVKQLSLQDSIYGEGREACWGGVVRALMAVSSSVTTLYLHRVKLTSLIWTYIATRKRLAYLHMRNCHIDKSTLPVSLDTKDMKLLRWFGDSRGFEKLFTKVRSNALSCLRFSTSDHIRMKYLGKAGIWKLKHYGFRSNVFPNVTSLTITVTIPAIWELRSFPRLRELEVLHGVNATPVTHWESYVLDSILLRPRDTPVLEKIAIKGDLYEWDILILLLERKNFLNEPGISPIKAIVSDNVVPYKLLKPLSALLGGKLVERDSNSSFSIEAIGQRTWNQSHKGCRACCYRFRECETPTKPGLEYLTPVESVPLTREHSLPSEYMIADPPLPLDMAQWLSGKGDRREAFVRGYNEYANTFHREAVCSNNSIRRGDFTITKDSLSGAIFRHHGAQDMMKHRSID